MAIGSFATDDDGRSHGASVIDAFATSRVARRRRAALRVAFAIVVAAIAAGCEQSRLRAPDVRYEPTPQHVVTEMLELARVGANDVVYDLGCGDGRIVITAVKTFGARGVCVDIDPERIRESRANAEQAGVAQRIRFLTQDLFETDLRDATVVTLFLWPSLNLKLRPTLWRDLAPGTRVVSYVHDMGDWSPRETRVVESGHGPRTIRLWVIPAARGDDRRR
jgi:SAM-dependent methyltransferase